MKQDEISCYMDFAIRSAERSKATRLSVGAVVVSPSGVFAMGFNGTPPGWDNGCETPSGDTKPEVLHAEQNALGKLIRSGQSPVGATIFQTHSPCIECAKQIYLAGVSELYYKTLYRSADGIDFLKKAGIQVTQI